ncbi:MAG: twin-arginine translocase TatA/TatE family subunit [Chloroflexi bacterium]|nr:twin-arginine translocase TatA/TatE family subunit [Chloroflexota bacterium]
MPQLGVPELVLILVIVVAVFGAGKLANIGGALGKGIKDFRKSVRDEDEPTTPRTENAPVAPQAMSAPQATATQQVVAPQSDTAQAPASPESAQGDSSAQ